MSKVNLEAMWDAISAERAVYLNTINSYEWMSGQMYLGGKLQKKNCSVCVFNAVISDKIWELRENGISQVLIYSGECIGRDTLVRVTREVSESGEWKMLSTEEKEELLEHMQDIRDSKAAKKVTGKEAAVDIENTMSAVQSKVDAYVASGAAGVIKVTSGHKSVDLKAEIREMIRIGMYEILTKERGVSEDNVPVMDYTAYEGFVWGVELAGWTEGQVTNPGNITYFDCARTSSCCTQEPQL
ncbi:uncharacterized protein EDB91DRAFT_1085894 [Suillus paluster]|uniref:uncharacterized protein n=1 Tax=Suillus paluster TaxID=48578 RepID=UPI001B87ECCD|nr:uncharacterized protein EDB91DRAFT_1085894 [Suillus paluster]KAG1728957.1 hypothetical protein EDB91DRAFT_1085894 [Suillus paluster]